MTNIRPGWKLQTVEDLQNLVDPEWLIEGILPEGCLTNIYGKPGHMKSFLALDWSWCMATGKDWLGKKVKRKRVLYLVGEGERGIKLRVKAWMKYHGISEIPNWVAFTGRPQVGNKDDVKGILEILDKAQFDVVVIDTLARHFGDGDENATKDMSQFVRHCDDIREKMDNGAIIIVHHSGKDETKKSRGSSSLTAAMDAEITVRKLTQHLDISCEKMKDGAEFGAFHVGWAPFGGSVVLVDEAQVGQMKRDQKGADAILAKMMVERNKGWTINELRGQMNHRDWKPRWEALTEGDLVVEKDGKFYPKPPH